MFIDNKYKRIYYNIINNAKQRNISEYTEKHHIIPKSLGGSNSVDNLVNLTAREHFVAHLLLTKFTEGKVKSKMFYALNRMMNSKVHGKIKCSRIYKYIRENHSKIVSKQFKGKNNNFTKNVGKTHEEIFGKDRSIEIKQSIARSNSSREWNDKSRKKMSKSQKLRYLNNPESFASGPMSEEHKLALSAAKKHKFKKLDTVVRTWTHPDHGTFIGTNTELAERYNYKVANLNRVCSDKFIHEHSYRKWIIKK